MPSLLSTLVAMASIYDNRGTVEPTGDGGELEEVFAAGELLWREHVSGERVNDHVGQRGAQAVANPRVQLR